MSIKLGIQTGTLEIIKADVSHHDAGMIGMSWMMILGKLGCMVTSLYPKDNENSLNHAKLRNGLSRFVF